MTQIEKARDFAHAAHDSIGQKRKYTLEPYWVHTDEVAELVRNWFGNDEVTIIAAHLYDVIEDVFPLNNYYSLYRIAELFGETVADYVKDLTDVYTKEAWPDLNRAKRKALERERIEQVPSKVKTIKLADLISNTKSIVEHDADFARVYLDEKLELLPVLSEGCPALLNIATHQVIDAQKKLGLTLPMLVAPSA